MLLLPSKRVVRVREDKRPNACTLPASIVDCVLHQSDLFQPKGVYPFEMDCNDLGLGLDHNVCVKSTYIKRKRKTGYEVQLSKSSSGCLLLFVKFSVLCLFFRGDENKWVQLCL